MKLLLKNVVLILAVVSLASAAIAATDTDPQDVTVTISEIVTLAVSGDPTLTIAAPASAGDLPADQTDNSTTMSWTCNSPWATERELTGSIDTLFDGINLYAEVTAAGSPWGSSTGKTQFVEAGGTYDFITSITNEAVSGETITYTAEVIGMVAPYTATTHTVTWTITDAL